MRSACSGLLMTLAAIMYVDDMNVLLKALENHTIEEFFAFIQAAIDFWEYLSWFLVDHSSRSNVKSQLHPLPSQKDVQEFNG